MTSGYRRRLPYAAWPEQAPTTYRYAVTFSPDMIGRVAHGKTRSFG
jgi:hypothetical protein